MSLAMGRPIVTAEALSNHRARLPGVNDVIWAPLYDFQTYVGTTGHTQLSFFVAPIGQGTTSAQGATGTKTIADTNMNASGQLTKGNEFYTTGIEVMFFPGIQPGGGAVAGVDVGEFVDDTYLISRTGILTFKVGSDRIYTQDSPLGQFPPVTRLACCAAVAGAPTTTGTAMEISYAVLSGEPYTLTPIYIEANQGFQVILSWPAAVPLTSTTDARIGVRLRGYLIRNAQ